MGTMIEFARRSDKDAPILSEPAAEKARQFMRARNDAAHGRETFLKRAEDVRKGSLAVTFEFLETIFSP